MKNTHRMIIMGVLALVFIGIAAFTFSTVYASSVGAGVVLQVTPLPGDPLATTIPNTGGDAVDPVGMSWVIWAILGISVLALLIALATRGTARRDL